MTIPPPVSGSNGNRLALITGAITAASIERGYGLLELGEAPTRAPGCVLCGNPASVELEHGPACRPCVNRAWDREGGFGDYRDLV
jgi:hypothetical protein